MARSVADALKAQGHYTACYCEENIYHLINHLTAQGVADIESLEVVFISNDSKTIPLFRQRSSSEPDGAVLWDYHVILIQPSKNRVWDLDTTLPCPTDLTNYLHQSLSLEIQLQPRYQRLYRVVPAGAYLREFASDRHHMFQNGAWLSPPPIYACIKNEQHECHTLDKYWSMDRSLGAPYGTVLDESSFLLQLGFVQKAAL